ncbi:MAG TPA: hypothetical protein VJ742_12395 [Nitrososphaera sp.]|nr:hypothetical protein [Nitrososphaera sp.]
MDDVNIDVNLDFMRAMWLLNRFDTVDQFINFWVMVGPLPLRYPGIERCTPWWSGLEFILDT